jgi:hypothetical protein
MCANLLGVKRNIRPAKCEGFGDAESGPGERRDDRPVSRGGQKWSQLYMKVLTKLVSGGDVRLKVDIEATLKDGATEQRVEETKAALRELGLSDDVKAG